MFRDKGVVNIGMYIIINACKQLLYKSLPCKYYVASVYCGKISCSCCSVRNDVVMGLYTMTFTFMLSSLPCLHTFWHAIPTSCYIF